MKQIRVKKTMLDTGHVREMNLDEKTWDIIRKNPATNVKWELMPPPHIRELKPGDIKEVLKNQSGEEITGTEEAPNPDYSNYSDQELREAAKNAGIRVAHNSRRETIIKRLEDQL